MPASLPSTLLLALLLGAVLTDLHARRIPNTLVLTGTTLALAAHTLSLAGSHPPLAGAAWWAPLAGLAAGLAVLMPLYLLRAMGAGDVKLMAMVGAFVGAPTVLMAALYTLLAGGLLSLAVMAVQGVSRRTLAQVRDLFTQWALHWRTGQGSALPPLQTTAARLPYAVAITVGTVAALVQAH
jgi:prepilin peptidase CpaA